MDIQYVCPKCHSPLVIHNNLKYLCSKDCNNSKCNTEYEILNDIPRFTEISNYANNFGYQWNKFDDTQIDNRKTRKLELSKDRLFYQGDWDPADLSNINILEVGSGAGRFSEVILSNTNANLYSIDYSNAVEANSKNNLSGNQDRFFLSQASVYEMPFPNNSFDKVFCFGVLQHTPSFDESIKALISKAKIGGEIVVDFYRIKGWWTKIHAKYFLRPFTKNIPDRRLLSLIENNIDWLIKISDILNKFGLHFLTRFLPIVDIKTTFPKDLSTKERREWAILDTFDMFSPEHDHPQSFSSVESMFKKHNCEITFSGIVNMPDGFKSNVVRAIKKIDVT